ncbi:MAG: UDP-N-acetylglucosamine 2-epimerase (non-hydrolyzing) [Anaerolineae bacterium]|nr:UDP-N-acetylglucosamine 2-epimerase (non-hydrolyzing) [Anaerolineae bacterium]
MKRVLTIFGTRPEAIKLAPVILELGRHPDCFENLVCVTGQHREMLDQVLNWFQIQPHYDLNLMRPNLGLSEFAAQALVAVDQVLDKVQPDVVIVEGDTTTVIMAALAAFYRRIRVAHVEAGLRTRDRYNPFPEEINRRMTGALATYHFAPTPRAVADLRAEQVPETDIFLTGNTVVDALLMTMRRPVKLEYDFSADTRFPILVTAHRRENFGAPFESLCLALLDIVERNPEVELLYPVHLNPNVREPVTRILSGHERIRLTEPLGYEQLVHLMAKAYLILTDSGGIQEEAPVLGKPTLVLRETSERMEAVEAGTACLVGTDRNRIVTTTERLLYDETVYHKMSHAGSPFGNGDAAERIVDILHQKLS